MGINQQTTRAAFIQAFNHIAKHRHRYEVFRDFVTMSAIALHNAVRMTQTLEDEYLAIVKRYNREEVSEICGLLGKLVLIMENDEPKDILGSLYMELELGSNHVGQFFTPHEVSKLMAQTVHGDQLAKLDKSFITLSEPACGAGGMVLAFASVMISYRHNPNQRLWVQCQDIDRTAALMCYLQLSLWHIPAVVLVGDTLAMEVREAFYTPAHYLGYWDSRLREREEEYAAAQPSEAVIEESEEPAPVLHPSPPLENMPLRTTGTPTQFDLGF